MPSILTAPVIEGSTHCHPLTITRQRHAQPARVSRSLAVHVSPHLKPRIVGSVVSEHSHVSCTSATIAIALRPNGHALTVT